MPNFLPRSRHLARVALPLATALALSPAWAIDVTGWTCYSDTTPAEGCGFSAPVAGEVVTASPAAGSTGYAWVSTAKTVNTIPPSFPLAQLPAGVPTTNVGDTTVRINNGATYTSTPFAAQAGSPISFYFNYITADGTTYNDFAWARLLDSAGQEVALLFTARSDQSASVVPGIGMPAAAATLTPATVTINAVAPSWAPLGTDSGKTTYTGHGYTGWVKADYTIAQAGSYKLEIGVVNWHDTAFASGLAMDGLLVAGQPPASLRLDNPGTLNASTAPVYQGQVSNPGSATTVDLLVTGPGGYSASLQAPIQNNAGVYSYSVTGAVLPAGSYTVVATLTGTSQTQTQSFTVQPNALVIVVPGTLPVATVGQPYSLPLSASGGVAPYSNWTATGLPAGLSINASTGEISGTPTDTKSATATSTVAAKPRSRSTSACRTAWARRPSRR